MTRPEKKSHYALKICPRCGVKVRDDRLDRHIRRIHLSQPSQKKTKVLKANRNPAMHGKRYAIISCPQCGASVYERHLEEHIRQFHQTSKQKSRSNTRATDKKLRKPSRKVSSNKRSRGKIFYIDKNGFVATREMSAGNGMRSRPLYERLALGARLRKDEGIDQGEPAYKKISKISEIKDSNISNNDLLQCPFCPSPVKRKNIWKHICNQHPGKNPEDALNGIKPYKRRTIRKL